MCFASQPPQDNSAVIARQQAQERENNVRAGKGQIDRAFGVFNPSYYDQFQKDYVNNYNPQVDEQFGDARKALRYNLARAGTIDSTPGQERFADLTQAYGDRRREVASNALQAANKLRGQVEDTKSDLYGLNTASADPSLAAVQATSRVGALQTAPSYSPVGDLFAGLINGGAQYYGGSQRGLPAGYRPMFAPGAGLPSPSGRVVA